MQQIRYQTTEAYYQVLQCLALVNVRQEAVNTLQEHLKKVTDQYEEGVTAKSDVLSSKVRLASEQQSLVTAENNYYKSMASLKNIIGFPQEGDLEIDDNLTYEKYDLSLKDCTNYALENRPDYLAAKYSVKSAEAEIKSAKSGTRPKVSATVEKNMSSEGANFNEDHNGSWSAGVKAQWNIFDNGITSAKVEQAKSALRKAKSTEKKAKEDILLEVNAAYLDLTAAETNIKTTKSAIELAKEDYEIAQMRYSEGIDTNLAVMEAQEKLTEAQNNYYNALYTYYISKSHLDKSIGVPLNIDVQMYVQAENEGKNSDKALEISKLQEQNVIVDKPVEESLN
jgi:outer membrane protein TolC